MDATSFELNLSIPNDARYVAALRDVAVHAARYAGCRGADADRFGAAVEAILLRCLTHGGPGQTPLPIVVRRGDGPVEVLVACERRFDAVAVNDTHISVAWVCERGRQMCRVARAMPLDL
jgi:hypothetical protein